MPPSVHPLLNCPLLSPPSPGRGSTFWNLRATASSAPLVPSPQTGSGVQPQTGSPLGEWLQLSPHCGAPCAAALQCCCICVCLPTAPRLQCPAVACSSCTAFLHLQPPQPNPTKPNPPPAGCSKVEEGVDLFGADLKDTGATSLEACYAACLVLPGCGSLTFVDSSNKCYMKKKDGFTRKSVAGIQSAVVAPCPSPPPSPLPPSPSPALRPPPPSPRPPPPSPRPLPPFPRCAGGPDGCLCCRCGKPRQPALARLSVQCPE